MQKLILIFSLFFFVFLQSCAGIPKKVDYESLGEIDETIARELALKEMTVLDIRDSRTDSMKALAELQKNNAKLQLQIDEASGRDQSLDAKKALQALKREKSISDLEVKIQEKEIELQTAQMQETIAEIEYQKSNLLSHDNRMQFDLDPPESYKKYLDTKKNNRTSLEKCKQSLKDNLQKLKSPAGQK